MKLFVTRGDTMPLKFQRKDAGGEVITTTPTEMTLTVKSSWGVEKALICKHLADMTKDEENVWHVVVQPADTENLPYGSYVWDIEVVTSEYVCTIAKGELQLTEEATWEENRE